MLCATCVEMCYNITSHDWEEVTELRSTQEEADTLMLLHARHAAQSGSQAVVISADDTDVLIMCVGFAGNKCQLFMKRGTQNRTRYFDICQNATFIGTAVFYSVSGFHAFT